jgi:hypothetical protein
MWVGVKRRGNFTAAKLKLNQFELWLELVRRNQE